MQEHPLRRPTIQEVSLLLLLLKRSTLVIPTEQLESLLVSPMDDGGMGGLTLFPSGRASEGRVFGEEVSVYKFTDIDGVVVFASLYVDSNGSLYELDVWKTDFGKLHEFPSVSEDAT